MAKTYVDVVKYNIHIDFEIKGVVDKPDIIGAVFGQSEGLLGEDMDLKELQNAGKVGRVDIKLESHKGVTKGEVLIPSSMDTANTSLLAAAIETVDKVGPCESKFKTSRIEDVRGAKRKEIASRAKELLKQLSGELPEAKEMAEELKEGARTSGLKAYGRDKLPAGPDIDSEESLIVVEGRADVLNLLRNNINNVIGMGGVNIAQAVLDLAKKKPVTLFVDGDRGGELNARKFLQIGRVEFIARAPDGKEVEELARKEILSSLKNKVTAEEFLREKGNYSERASERPMERREFPGRQEGSVSERGEGEGRDRRSSYGSSGSRGYSARSSGGYGEGGSGSYGGRSSGGYGARPYSSGSRYGGRSSGGDRARSSGGYGARPYSSGSRYGGRSSGGYGRGRISNRGYSGGRRQYSDQPFFTGSGYEFPEAGKAPESSGRVYFREPAITDDERKSFEPIMEKMKGSLKASLLDEKLKEVASSNVRGLVEKLAETKNVHAIVFDGIVTKRLLEEAGKQGVKYIVGIKKGKIEKAEGIRVITM